MFYQIQSEMTKWAPKLEMREKRINKTRPNSPVHTQIYKHCIHRQHSAPSALHLGRYLSVLHRAPKLCQKYTISTFSYAHQSTPTPSHSKPAPLLYSHVVTLQPIRDGCDNQLEYYPVALKFELKAQHYVSFELIFFLPAYEILRL